MKDITKIYRDGILDDNNNVLLEKECDIYLPPKVNDLNKYADDVSEHVKRNEEMIIKQFVKNAYQ